MTSFLLFRKDGILSGVRGETLKTENNSETLVKVSKKRKLELTEFFN